MSSAEMPSPNSEWPLKALEALCQLNQALEPSPNSFHEMEPSSAPKFVSVY